MSGFIDVSDRGCVLLDFDGTLADTKGTICYCATVALSEFGMDAEEMGDLTRLIGPPFPQAYEEVYGMSAAEAMAVTERYREVWDGLGADAIPLFDGIGQMLRILKSRGKTLAVATSKAQRVIEEALAALGIEDAFDAVVGKPHDRAFTKAQTIGRCLEVLGAGAGEAVMVGDRHFDVEGAHEAGVASVGVTWGGVSVRSELAGADLIVDTVGELTDELCGGAV